MKKSNYWIIISIILLSACDKIPTNNSEDGVYKIIPDDTPFIAGLLEATNDTVHHYPEIVVGYVNDGNFVPEYKEVKDIKELYNPTLWTQVVRTLQRFELTFEAESEAKVMVTGPLNKVQQKTVVYIHEGNGVYGDVNSELELLAGDEYLLSVELNDGRAYSKITKIINSIEIEVPDTIKIDIVYKPFENGTPREESIEQKYITYKYPKDYTISEIQSNSNNDRDILLLGEKENLLFQDRSNFLRAGSLYGISTSKNTEDTLHKRWVRDLSDPRNNRVTIQKEWMRFSYFGKDMWENFQNLSNWFGMKGIKIEEMYSRFEEALSTRDSTYLFDVSTIEKIDENGEILPKSDNDAIGFFAGYFSLYKKTVLIPVRNFDLDSVLTAHGY